MVSSKSLNRLSVTIKGGQGGSLEVARARIWLMKILFTALYCVVAVRLFDLMVIQGVGQGVIFEQARYSVQEKEISSIVSEKDVKRGDVVDRNGVLLATSLKTASLYADPKNIIEPSETAVALNKIFPDLSYEGLLKKLQKSGRFVWIKRGIVPEDQMKILRIGEPGLGFREEYKRLYPQSEISAHIVGYSDIDGQGVMGIERSFHDVIDGSNIDEESVRTTLDIRFQHALRSELLAAKEKFDALSGTGVILDAQKGDVLALVSLPDFDPHAPASSKNNARFNRATLGVYELGSVFKVFSTAALLETHDDALSMSFDATEPLKRGRHTIRDFHPEKRVLTVPEVFMVSSNIGTALMGEMIGAQKMQEFYKKLGLMSRPEIAFSEVGKPLYPRPWRDINTLTASYGHGIAVSPLQLASAVATVINGGYKVSPRFVLPKDGVQKPVQTRLLSEETSEVMRSLMKLVVTEGTAKQAAVEGYEVGGKTGTAEKPGKGGYDRNRLISSFVGGFPINDPRYVIFVMLDEPKGTKETYGYATAGWTAAPVFSKVVKRIVSIEAINPESNINNKFKQKQDVSNVSYGGRR